MRPPCQSANVCDLPAFLESTLSFLHIWIVEQHIPVKAQYTNDRRFNIGGYSHCLTTDGLKERWQWFVGVYSTEKGPSPNGTNTPPSNGILVLGMVASLFTQSSTHPDVIFCSSAIILVDFPTQSANRQMTSITYQNQCQPSHRPHLLLAKCCQTFANRHSGCNNSIMPPNRSTYR